MFLTKFRHENPNIETKSISDASNLSSKAVSVITYFSWIGIKSILMKRNNDQMNYFLIFIKIFTIKINTCYVAVKILINDELNYFIIKYINLLKINSSNKIKYIFKYFN